MQDAETKGEKENVSYFLFDQDQRPTTLTSSPNVRIAQWDRYCLENYLLDVEILSDTIRRISKHAPENLGAAQTLCAEIAMRQLKPQIIEEIYDDYKFESPGLRVKDKAADITDAANHLFDRIATVQRQTGQLDRASWTRAFEERCNELLGQRQQEWTANWQVKCTGNTFLHDLRNECHVSGSVLTLKRNLLIESRLRDREGWKLLDAKPKKPLGSKQTAGAAAGTSG